MILSKIGELYNLNCRLLLIDNLYEIYTKFIRNLYEIDKN